MPASVDADRGEVCCPGAQLALLDAEPAGRLAVVFKALADPTRVRVLQYLASSHGGTACACHLPSALGISQPTLSFHMKKLHDAGLVSRDRRGRWVHYTVEPEQLASANAFLHLCGEPTATRDPCGAGVGG